MTTVIDQDNRLAGIFTDGDLRRMLDRGIDVRQATVTEVMSADPITITSGRLAAEALQIMESRKINGLIVCDEQHRPLGALNMHDLLRAGVV
jgi:arabinose-5-phosphate isomerase